MLAWGLLVLGLALIFLEFSLPGGIVGTAGAILLVIAITINILYAETLGEVAFFLGALAVLLTLTIFIALKAVRRASFLDSDQEGYRADSYDRELMGKEGVCITNLRPGGFVKIEKKKYAAISLSGFIDKGEKVVVTDVEGETVTVKRS